MHVSVRSDWTASYPDPITATQGDKIILTGRTDFWNGYQWIWAISRSTKEGWVPDTLVKNGVASYSYSAIELSCKAGQVLIAHQRTHGWTWCSDGETAGWVPDHCLDI